MKSIFKFICLAVCVIAASCSSDEAIPNVEHLKRPVEIYPFEELLNNKIKPYKDSAQTLFDKVLGFDCYFTYIMEFGTDIAKGEDDFYKFKHDSSIMRLYDTVKAHYPNMKKQEAELSDAFAYFRHYFPNTPYPGVYSCISEFGPAAATCDTAIFVSLDMYLGSSFPYYNYFDFPEYMQHRFRGEYITPNIVKALVKSLASDSVGRRLIDLMIAEGKIIYIAKKLMPHTPDSLIMTYKNNQINWLNENEGQVWGFFIENKLLYNNAMMDVRKYITDGPTTSGMPRESPGNVGSWVGYRIVKQYMSKHPKTTMTELINLTDGQKMLSEAKYKPR